ncbi:HNH endonuclease [Vibrio fluvialis]|nr:HNH endonuclease [Vibrio fluvialis]MBY8161872.1 HNH endonuclease [Vibrio fluvialis]
MCECCGEDAPFKTSSGEPFLEVHHLIRLMDNELDTVENCAGICPNCHRRLHYGEDRDTLTRELLGKDVKMGISLMQMPRSARASRGHCFSRTRYCN